MAYVQIRATKAFCAAFDSDENLLTGGRSGLPATRSLARRLER